MRHYLPVLAFLIGLPVALPALADVPQCSLKRVTELTTDTSHGELLAKIQIEGHDAWMRVETASPFTTISGHLVDTLKLTRFVADAGMVDMANKQLSRAVKVHELQIGNLHVNTTAANILVSDEEGADPYADGTLGANILINYDVELDLKHGKIYLYQQDHCTGQVVYWTQDFMSVPFSLDGSRHIVFDTTLDGHSLRTVLDTGSQDSTLSTQIARKVFDLDPLAAGTKPDGQFFVTTGTSLPFFRHRFAKLSVAGIDFQNTELLLTQDMLSTTQRNQQNGLANFVPSEINQDTPLTIGLHHLMKLRVFIAYRERDLYISAADAN
jgi:Aspartyl protease